MRWEAVTAQGGRSSETGVWRRSLTLDLLRPVGRDHSKSIINRVPTTNPAYVLFVSCFFLTCYVVTGMCSIVYEPCDENSFKIGPPMLSGKYRFIKAKYCVDNFTLWKTYSNFLKICMEILRKPLLSLRESCAKKSRIINIFYFKI